MLPCDTRAPSAGMLQKYLAAVLVAGFLLAGKGMPYLRQVRGCVALSREEGGG